MLRPANASAVISSSVMGRCCKARAMHCTMNQDIWRIENVLDNASPLLLSSIVSGLIAARFFAKFGSDSSASRVTIVPGNSTFSQPGVSFSDVVKSDNLSWTDDGGDENGGVDVVLWPSGDR